MFLLFIYLFEPQLCGKHAIIEQNGVKLGTHIGINLYRVPLVASRLVTQPFRRILRVVLSQSFRHPRVT